MTDSPRETAAETATLLLCDARLADGRTVDVRLSGRRIEAVGTAGSLTPATGTGRQGEAGAGRGGTRIDLRGYLLLPAPAEPHAHLDQALTAGGPPAGDSEDVQRRVTEGALLQLGHGATAVRSHVRIGDVQGLRALEAVLQARRALRGLVEVRTVAVPRLLTGVAGADGAAMLRDALKMGADAVGGCPDLDPDPSGCTEALLSMAAEFGVPVDLHTAADDPARLARLAAMCGGMRPGVTLGPCHGLGALPAHTVAAAGSRLAAAGISVVALPQGGCCVLDRGGPTPVRLLRAAGVRVTAGSGALGDLANPVGRGDPLEAAFLLSSHGECRPQRAYDLVSREARAVMGLPEVRVEAGFPAELLALRGDSLAGVLSLAYSRIVIHQGRVVSRTSAVREYCDSSGESVLDLPRQANGEA
ncbi:amidohydrolase family protein [Streptomyces sp. NBC_01190]|uniref:amidohydrolase family protein n=1 Tax=Streptomyces sp. NBC_01190 TaxID=2903767 RepID=UPI00386D47B5|nr:amidohydrolase family protein [Streptomyces sp. NBC_01190]